MSIKDLLFISGGLKDERHMERLYLERFDIVRFDFNKNKYVLITLNLENELLSNDFKILPSDKIIIFSKDTFLNQGDIQISGSVRKPGFYTLKENMSLNDLLIESGGVSDSLYYFRVEIASIKPKSKTLNIYAKIQVIDFTNDESIYKSNNNGYRLKPFDKILVRPSPFFSKQKTVYVGGSVYYPGNYFMSGPDDRASDLIKRAGGLRSDGYPEASRFVRNNERVLLSFKKLIKKPRSKENFVLLEGDSIIIGKKPNLVKISGGVYAAGNFQYIIGKKLNYYISKAGGFKKGALRNDVFVIYPDGKSKQKKLLSNPTILDGSEIIVPIQEDSEQFDLTRYVMDLTKFWADLSQAYLMLLLALRAQ